MFLIPALSLGHHASLISMSGFLVLENVGIPLPTEIAYIVAQHQIEIGHSYYGILFLFTLAHIVGAITSFWIGRFVAAKLGAPKENSSHAKAISWQNKYGAWAVFAARLIGQVRPWTSFVAGGLGMQFVPFIVATTLGTVLFNVVSLSLTKRLLAIAHRHPAVNYLISAFIAFGIITFLIWVINYYRQQGMKKRKQENSQAE